jgi:hypothetical protein
MRCSVRIAVAAFLLLLTSIAVGQAVSSPPYTFSLVRTLPTVQVRVQMNPVTCQPPPSIVTPQPVAGGVIVVIESADACNPNPLPPADVIYDLGAFDPGSYSIQFQGCAFGPNGGSCTTFAELPFDVAIQAGTRSIPTLSLTMSIALGALMLAVGLCRRARRRGLHG